MYKMERIKTKTADHPVLLDDGAQDCEVPTSV